MRLFILELPLYLWIVLALVAVAAIALFAWACWRNIKRPNQDKTGKMLLCLVFLLSFITAQAMEGDGSYFNPYRIASTSDWNAIASSVNAGQNTYYQKCFRLEADITVDMSNGGQMMGNDNHAFRGSFDGVVYDALGKVIRKYHLNR